MKFNDYILNGQITVMISMRLSLGFIIKLYGPYLALQTAWFCECSQRGNCRDRRNEREVWDKGVDGVCLILVHCDVIMEL